MPRAQGLLCVFGERVGAGRGGGRRGKKKKKSRTWQRLSLFLLDVFQVNYPAMLLYSSQANYVELRVIPQILF